MKKILMAAAVSALATGSALAQSTVTIYGRFNVSGERQDAAGVKTFQLSNNSSRIGFKGSEDLGGGLRAGFQLEHGFDVSTGQPSGAFWGRQSEVNLSGGFGMLRLGNFTSEAYYATADYISMHNHDTGSSSDALYAYLPRNGNKISYRLPEFAKGLSLELGVAAAEGAANQTKSYDFAANYNVGALQFGLGAQQNDKQEQIAARVLAELGSFVLGAYVQQDKEGFNPVLRSTAFGKRTTYRLSGMYSVGASEFHLNYGDAGKYDKVANSAAKQYTVAYNYNLSKRTKVYTYYTKVNDSNAKLYGGDFSSVAFGLRHNF